jgi:hypothetical protein
MFIQKGESIIADAPIVELVIPTVYSSKGMFSRQAGYYNLFLVAMARSFSSQSEYDSDNGKKDYKPIALPVLIKSKPTLVETDVIEVPRGSSAKPMYKLVYYKGDEVVSNVSYIKRSDNTKVMYQLNDDGKADFLPYTVIAELLENVNYYNATKLPVPIEALHAIVATRSKNPKNYQQDARFMDKLPTAIISLNPRETMAAGSVSGMFGFEDVNTALMVSANRYQKGSVDKATTLEKIILTGEA